jgi:hypothetical protein
MELWLPSDITHACMESLAKHDLLRQRTEAMVWLMPGCEEASAPPDGYVVSFVPFHKREVMTPPHRFLQGLLHHYGIEL